MMIVVLRHPRDAMDKGDAVQHPIKPVSAVNAFRPLRPVRDGIEAGFDLFGS
jgi:hypothetical protein